MAFDERARPTPPSARSRSAGGPTTLLTQQAGFAPEDIIFDPNVLAVATGIERAQRLRQGVHRGAAADQERCPGAQTAAASPTCRSPSAATTSSARRCTRRSCSTPSAPAWTWASSTPASSPSTRTSRPDLLELVEDVVFDRRARRDRTAGRVREPGRGRGEAARGRPLVARSARRERNSEHTRPRRRRLGVVAEGGAAARRAAARRDRRAASWPGCRSSAICSARGSYSPRSP